MPYSISQSLLRSLKRQFVTSADSTIKLSADCTTIHISPVEPVLTEMPYCQPYTQDNATPECSQLLPRHQCIETTCYF
jgi:hypothetical protein